MMFDSLRKELSNGKAGTTRNMRGCKQFLLYYEAIYAVDDFKNRIIIFTIRVKYLRRWNIGYAEEEQQHY